MLSVTRTPGVLARFLLVLVVMPLTARSVVAEPISWMERYALAADRETLLAELIPGSDDFYFYHCLHYQTTGQLERSEAILRDWLAEHQGQPTPEIEAMIDRQRLLTYEQSPERSIDHLIRRLGIQLEHAAPPAKNERRFPSQLDEGLLGANQIVQQALQRGEQLKPRGMQLLAERFRRSEIAGIPISLRDFLTRVTDASLTGLDELVIQELTARKPNEKRFGDLPVHDVLTLDELRSVAAKVPEVAHDQAFVAATLRRLRPAADSDPSQQQPVRIDFLSGVESYVQTLPAGYNSLKAAAAFRLLEANLQRGVFDRDLLIRYLQLPRVSPIVHPEWLRRGGQQANLGDDFMDLAWLPPIGNEEPVVRAHLEHFLRDAENTDAFNAYLQSDYLRRVFAETKLLAGIGPEQQWYKLLSAAQRQEIRDAVQLRLAPDNPEQFAADQPTQLKVDVKNVDELVVRIYEIHTQSYYRSHDRPIDTDIDLDGLLATHERKLSFPQPAIQRHRETLELPEISGRGVWIVDLVGKGVRTRALVRRGWIDHVDSLLPDGMAFTVIDEQRRSVPSATMWVGSREFVADEQGRIVLPPVVDEVSRRAVISDGSIARQVSFSHLQERYQLTAGMQLDRTQLQTGGQADLLVRPRLLIGETPVDPQALTDVSVRIEASDLDELVTTMQLNDLQLDQLGELVVPIRVPARLAKLRVTLSGKIRGLADAREQSLETSHTWDLAGIRETSQTRDAYLTRDGDQYVIEVRGRNGELVPGEAVIVSLITNLRDTPVEQTLQADDNGQVRLGTLTGVTRISFSVPSGSPHGRDLVLDQVRWANEIHTTLQRAVELPLADLEQDVRTGYRLLEVRDGKHFADLSEQLSSADGLLRFQASAAGDYQLIDRSSGQSTRIVVVDGPQLGQVAVGQIRHRSISPAVPLGIASITREGGDLKIKLSGTTQLARVHVYASRYLDQTAPIDQLQLPMPVLSGRRASIPRCGYVSDLRLGEEYQYVLRRRYAAKYPGVMLPQPGVILNPWETEETSSEVRSAALGDAPPPAMALPSEAAAAMDSELAAEQAEELAADYDFLADAGVVIANLRPDDRGIVTIAGDAIAGLPIVQLVVCDPITILQRTVPASLQPVETVDLRLAKSLDVSTPLSFERGVIIASPDQPLDLRSLGSAQLQVFESVGSLWKLYKTLCGDERMNDFDPLANWHTLAKADKLDVYSRLASHELHLFLYFHDRSFFGEVIQPYLANKKEKQFVDHWLLGADLSPYFKDLWRYHQLNAAEKALLAMRLPEARVAVQRELREIVASRDEDHAEVRRGIESALLAPMMDLQEGGSERSLELMLGEEEFNASAMYFDAIDPQAGRPTLRRRMAERGAEQQVEQLEQSRSDASKLMLGRASGMGMGGMGLGGVPFYRELDTTKQWAEGHWDRVRVVGGPSPAELIEVTPFWSDLAALEADAIGVSASLLRPVDSRHAALVALAVCGLPLSPGDVGLPADPDTPYRPAHAVAVVSKRLKKLEVAGEAGGILIGQRFESLDQPSENRPDGSARELAEFLSGVAHRGQVVVSNPTAQQRVIEVFWQIPAGSLPLAAHQATDSRTIVLEPFAVEAIEYQFYFPAAGRFTHYPATVGAEGKLIARGSEKEFVVVAQPTDSNAVTWERIAEAGTPAQIEAFLAGANLREIDWMRIAHRMRDAEVYRAVVKTLGQTRLAIMELWAYSFAHQDVDAMRSYLALRDDLVQRVGPVLHSPLLDVDPVPRRMHELLEYAPLVPARIHRLGEQDEILNATFRAQYESFTRVLGFSSEITAGDRLVLSYYLLIQNRIAEAIESFEKIERDRIDSQLQYDYLDAYLALHREQYDRAERVARQYAEHPVPRWNNRFRQVLDQLRQRRELNEVERLVTADVADDGKPIAEGSGDLSVLDREQKQAAASDQQPEVIVQVDGDSLRIDHRRTRQATLNFYGVDLELLFSKAPFVREDLQRMAMVRPARSEQIEFDDATGVGRFDLDDNLRRQTLLVEVVAGASRSTSLYYGGDMTTYVSESYGQLQTTDAQSHLPISTAYVKVYAKYPSGEVRFYKDGYTDSRGRFDYASISASEARGATRFAILVVSDEKGATLHDVAAPNQ
jgi:hypothetical protein